jgi:hypothetical protein
MKEFRVLVCGGREYGWKTQPNGNKILDQKQINFLNTKLNIMLAAVTEIGRELIIIQGEAQGADDWAKKWAIKNNVKTIDFPADWKQHGKYAGFKRNTQMLEEGKPDLVIAFPGGNGTKMMCEIAEKGDVTVKKYENVNI